MEKTRPAFENAILDSVLSDFDDVPPSESIGHEFSPEFELKAQKLIKKSGSNAWHCVNTAAKRLLIAAIIAALLTGTVLAVPALREGLIKFFIHDNGSMYFFTVDRDVIQNAPEEIETVYTLGYLPDGYDAIAECVCNKYVSFNYMNENSDIIWLDQELVTGDPRNTLGGLSDSERSTLEHIELNGYKVVRISHEDGEIEFLWTDNEYFFNLFCSNVSPDEAEKIFFGIIPDAELTDTVKNGGRDQHGKICRRSKLNFAPFFLGEKGRFLLCGNDNADIINLNVPCGAARRGLTRNSVQIRSSPAAVNGDEGADATVFMGRRARD